MSKSPDSSKQSDKPTDASDKPMRIMIDFKGGGIMDGSVCLDREIKLGEMYSFTEMVVVIAGVSTGYTYNVGHHFHVPSPGRLARTVVRQAHETGLSDSYEYEITDRVEGDNELLLVAEFVGQRPDKK